MMNCAQQERPQAKRALLLLFIVALLGLAVEESGAQKPHCTIHNQSEIDILVTSILQPSDKTVVPAHSVKEVWPLLLGLLLNNLNNNAAAAGGVLFEANGSHLLAVNSGTIPQLDSEMVDRADIYVGSFDAATGVVSVPPGAIPVLTI